MNDLLLVSLSAAVPLRIAELERLPRDEVFAEVSARGGEWSKLLAEKGDILMFGGGKRGEVAEAHTALVNALAHLAFCPGGVKFADMRFEAKGGTG